jgi:hypothetical protein
MDRTRYRSWLIRAWPAGGPGEDAKGTSRVCIECIAHGTEVEIRGEPAADLAGRIEAAFGAHEEDAAAAPAEVAEATGKGGRGWTA